MESLELDSGYVVESFNKNPDAHDQKVNRNKRLDHISREIDQEVRADNAAEYSRDDQTLDDLPIDILEPKMGQTRCQSRKNFGNMNTGTCCGRGDTSREQERIRADTISHAKAPIDDLRKETDQEIQQELIPIKIFKHDP